MHAISAENVTKTYGDVTALAELSLSVEVGSSFGLLGTNGAGKTTLFKLLVGHIRPDAGVLRVAGRDVADAGADIRRPVGYLPEHPGFPPSLTGREVLTYHARLRGIPSDSRRERVEDVLATVGLPDAADRRVAGYSNGMNRRLGLATALLSNPSILLLDEPTAGLDPRGVATFHEVIDRLTRQDDLTLVVASHVLSEVETLCDSVAVLDEGELRVTGTVDELRARTDATVRVTVRVPDSVPVDEALAVARERCTTATATGDVRIDVRCERDAVVELLTALDSRDLLASIEVREPGLDEVFELALRGELAPVEVNA